MRVDRENREKHKKEKSVHCSVPSRAHHESRSPRVRRGSLLLRDHAPKSSLRGTSRSEGRWHLYTAVFDRASSELFVDGRRENGGCDIGANGLDGLSLG